MCIAMIVSWVMGIASSSPGREGHADRDDTGGAHGMKVPSDVLAS